ILLVAKDRQGAELTPAESRARPQAPACPVDAALVERAVTLLGARPIVIIAGNEVARAGATSELAAIAQALDAEVGVAPDARDAFDNRSPRFIGVCGAMGAPAVPRALARAAACLLVGTRLPLLARQGIETLLGEKPLVSLGREPPYVASASGLHLGGEVGDGLRALRRGLGAGNGPASEERPPTANPTRTDPSFFGVQSVLSVLERKLPEESVLIVDAGNTGAASVHYLPAPRGGRFLLAMGMAGMGYAFGAAIGAAFATGKRCTVLAGDGAFFMNGLDVHTAVEHELPVTYVILDNAAHGMCLVREQLLLHENAGYNTFHRSHIGTGLAAMFPGLAAWDCRTNEALEQALQRAYGSRGPAVIAVELEDVEIPPFTAFQKAVENGITTVSRGGAHVRG
ncbi:MAG TPA: thiamine pyrophosphate-dependent enzyme, partial [Polyangiaceae bacterium]